MIPIDSNVKNLITLNGNDESIKKALTELWGTKLYEINGRFSFSTFSKFPQELKDKYPTQKVVSNEEYSNEIMNHEIKVLVDEVPEFDIKPISKKIQLELIDKHGYDNGEDWCISNWGTKWSPYESQFISKDEFYFFTVNDTPRLAMIEMSKKYSDITFNIKYADESIGYNVGEYTLLNGEVLHEYTPKTFTKESFMLACELFDDDYYTSTFIQELSDSEIEEVKDGENDFVRVILDVILELELVDSEYSLSVNEYLLIESVKTEQYEYAQKLKNMIDSIK
tara:strand:- start:1688 stop:2530 length:843 start_codon:yes stop_codon:yes gene_type:complete